MKIRCTKVNSFSIIIALRKIQSLNDNYIYTYNYNKYYIIFYVI